MLILMLIRNFEFTELSEAHSVLLTQNQGTWINGYFYPYEDARSRGEPRTEGKLCARRSQLFSALWNTQNVSLTEGCELLRPRVDTLLSLPWPA